MFLTMILKVLALLLCSLALTSISKSSELRQMREPLLGLTMAQTIQLRATNKTVSNRLTDASYLQEIFSKRMAELGYTTETDSTQDYDITVQLDCQEQSTMTDQTVNNTKKTKLKTLTHGPPCIFHYLYEGQIIPWQRIDRVVYAEGLKIAQSLDLTDQKYSTSSRTMAYLEKYEFPLLLAAEWNHIDRLIGTFHAPETTHNRQRFIIFLLGEVHAEQAFSFLINTLKEKHLTVATARALGHLGEQARPHLLNLLQSSSNWEVQAAAAYGLGNVGALTGDTHSTPFLLKVLMSPRTDIKVQTEIVWALGKAPDFAAYEPLETLEQQIWKQHSNDPDIQKLREAVDWSIREVRQGGHTDDF